MSSETTMPPQFEHPWGNPTGQLSLPEETSLDLFNFSFDDMSLSFDLKLDDTPLFDGFPLELECLDLPGEGPGSSQVIHDCMWAGTCVDDKERPNPLDRVRESPVKSEPALQTCSPAVLQTPTKDTEIVPSYTPTSVHLHSRQSSVKSNNRSLLRTNQPRACAATVVGSERTAASQDESDDSGRPDTPQSMSSSDSEADHHHQLSSSHREEVDEDDDEDDEETEEEGEEDDDDDEDSADHDASLMDDDAPIDAVPVSKVTGQTVRTSLYKEHHERASRFDSRPQQTVSNHFFNDHSYHLSKTDHPSIPGNLTPSDSEDEIDVVSVCGEKASSRSSSQGALPSNPSARDRHALQQTMASAMKRSAYSAASPYPSYLNGRQPSGKLARMQAERQRQRERKRRAQERDDSSEEDIVRPSKKRAKHHHHAYKTARRGAHSFKSASSDSEPDSCEKRSLHNNMERQRRVDLRNAFEDLRVVVPVLNSNPRAAKVVILKEASMYCQQLTDDADNLQHESKVLERERERLLARVSYLRKQVASMRMGV
ncbi:Myc protein [Frankliniella fusca]|uniref:Myc protein n=1 Tax=Frankliniella fusca TaxID=407009 RepID=A0AAE1L8A2_9NEOP|nr:Myc protein [Frankliniella fusca]